MDGCVVALKKVQIFEMMDAKARQDCIKEIDLLKVGCGVVVWWFSVCRCCWRVLNPPPTPSN